MECGSDSCRFRQATPVAAHHDAVDFGRNGLPLLVQRATVARRPATSAAALLRKLAGAAGEETSRRDFELQADNLVRLAATNRDIATYNEAIRQYNAGSRRAALKTVEALLATATDPVVIRDARSRRKARR